MPYKTILRLADTLAGRTGVLRRPLSADRLAARACRRARTSDFGPEDFLEPLRRLLEACAHEADLSLVGRMATQWDVQRFLANLLRLRAEETRHPAILDEPIERPIFITGLPRSGTTFLHRLLMEDDANRAPLVWQTIYPYPIGSGRDQRVPRVARQLRMFESLAPDFRGLHPLEATAPQECSEITAHVFRSLRFDTTYRIPSYRQWLDADGHVPAYQFHRRFLQHLQHQQAPGRWVLKCPDHLFSLRDLRAVYPDARLVFVHRDPVKVLLSVAKLTEVLRRPFSRRIDRHAIGRQESARWFEGTQRICEASGAPDGDAICHIHYLDLVSDPLRTVGALYQHFDLPLRPETAARISRLVAARPRGGYRHDLYHFEDHGLDAAAEGEKFRAYMLRFGIEAEATRPASAATPQELSLSSAR